MKTRRRDERAGSERRFLFPVALLVLVVLFFMVLRAAPAQDDDAKRAQVSKGGKLFEGECASCHSVKPEDASPFGPPMLAGLFGDKSKTTPKQAEEIIRKGQGAMPAYGATLSDEQIDSLLAYLKSLSPSTAKSSPTQSGPPAQQN